ncbi:hypothetical protein DFP74_3093 [Nocardiopsis sp. Huas11]|uniref:hypothetical protein n=1 Tax=Nocardiopsis sp. Huas11 TaxID=2183912 RepID=UPI000F1D93EA|nr:hypothetical protein [Nocardiopsis sp. Huas11]RKS07424.1 hypothetical protein DFP74_3093 [Nocardiopsis sp. Huas11]
MPDYTVTVTRDEDLWAVVIDGLPENVAGVADYVRFDEIRDEVPEFIADLTRSDPDDFTITWRYEFGGKDVTEDVLHVIDAEARFVEAMAEHERSRAKALEAMREAGLSQRSMGEVVHLSHQRVQQLLSGSGGSGRRGRKPGSKAARESEPVT